VKKYLTIFKISFQQEFAYKVNFVMWRVRNIIQVLINYFLWNAIFIDASVNLFGYNREKILTYIFGTLIVRALVLSARAMDVSGDVANGDLSNYLVRPISYFKYWFTRDLSSKALNLSFAALEFTILFVILRPTLYLQMDPVVLLMFIFSIMVAVVIYFSILFMVSSIPFWSPELGWGGHFIVTVIIVEFLSGSLFPIDILPIGIQRF
jgi:ABC-2 type transport system permease protein